MCCDSADDNGVRCHRDSAGRHVIELAAISPYERSFRSPASSFHARLMIMPEGGDLIRSLCRFLC